MINVKLINSQTDQKKVGNIPDRLTRIFPRLFLLLFLCSLFIMPAEIWAQPRYASDLALPVSKTSANQKEAETMRRAFNTLSPYIAETGGGAMTIQQPDNENKLRSLSLSTSYITSLANLYNGSNETTWLDKFPVLGIEVQEMDTSDAYQLSSVKLGFFDGQLWIVFEPLGVAGESISLRWQYYW